MTKTYEQEVKQVNNQRGSLVVSLDFELAWGVRDKKNFDSYKDNILGVRSVVPRILQLFERYKIHATWATVGFLFFETRQELIAGLPANKPNYLDAKLSPYPDIDQIGCNEEVDPFHYASSLIKMIASSPNQEIGTHTFSHYYCLEEGQTPATFSDDIDAAKKVASQYELNLKSLVFPRNQFNEDYTLVKESNTRYI